MFVTSGFEINLYYYHLMHRCKSYRLQSLHRQLCWLFNFQIYLHCFISESTLFEWTEVYIGKMKETQHLFREASKISALESCPKIMNLLGLLGKATHPEKTLSLSIGARLLHCSVMASYALMWVHQRNNYFLLLFLVKM